MKTGKVLSVVVWNPPYDIDAITLGAVEEFNVQIAQAVAKDLNIDLSKISIESLHWLKKGKEIIPGSDTPLVVCTWNDGTDKPLLSQKVREVIFRLVGEKSGPKYDPNSSVARLSRRLGALKDIEEHERLTEAGLI